MPRYAQLQGGICFAETYSSGPLEGPDLIAVDESAPDLRGMRHIGGGVFEPVVPPTRPRIVIQSIAADAGHTSGTTVAGSEVTCPAGATITVEAELQDEEGDVLAVTDNFRMPIRARDGRERVLLAHMVDGLIQITAPMPASGVWAVNDSMVNEGLPPETQMAFDGITLFVYEA